MHATDSGRPVLVTGASRGLGRSLVLHLASEGFQVFAGVRSDAAAASLRAESGDTLQTLTLDVTQDSHIEQAVGELEAELGDRGLWGLVNNAGILDLGPVETTRVSDFRKVFEVNVFGVLALTKRCLPLVRRASGRIVNVSSVNGELSMPFASAYCASKFALEAASDALRMEVAPWGIGVSVIQPGVTASDIRDTAMAAWSERRSDMSQEQAKLYGEFFAATDNLVTGMKASAAGPEDFCGSVTHALTAEAPHTRYATGPDAAGLLELAALPDRERDQALQVFWEGGE